MVAAPSRLRGFNCGQCGAAVELRALSHTRTVVCTTCGSVLDPRDPNVHVLQKAALRESITPMIPLGSRGTWHGQPYDVIGFQQRSIEVDGVRYAWDEYVLFNPYRGFRYLSSYQGHWNDIETVRELPRQVKFRGRPEMNCRGETFKHFQAATARTDYVLGEFPWRVRVGDQVEVNDFVAPPLMLSSEGTVAERTWSLGRYTVSATLWSAFSLPGDPLTPTGVFANQPYPHHGRVKAAVAAGLICAGLLLLLLLVRLLTADREQVFAGDYRFVTKDAALVTDPFTISEDGTVEIVINASNLNNAWIDFDLALINMDTGVAFNIAREVSHYSGTDSDGAWSEGSREAEVLLPAVPAGQYYLRVEPTSDAAMGIPYRIRVRRDVVSMMPYGIALVGLAVPAVLAVRHRSRFERTRLQESDYGG
jgi:hypothetical protein